MKTEQKKNTSKSQPPRDNKHINFYPIGENLNALLYYGFTTTSAPKISKEDTEKALKIKESWTNDPEGLPWIFSTEFAEERVSLFRKYAEENMQTLPQPVLLAYETNKGAPRNKKSLNLDIIGSTSSVSEAMLLKTAIAILKDNGHEDLFININSIGDKESSNKFAKELTTYYKKNLGELSSVCRQNFKKDSFYVVPCDEKVCSALKEGSPVALSCLSDESRTHFRDVLEYLETMGVPYNIDNCLISDRKYCSQTVFEIAQKGKSGGKEVLATGFRFDGFAQKIGFKKDIPGAGIKIFIDKNIKSKEISKIKKPKIFFIQISDDAKLKSLEVIETLRKDKVLVYHLLGRDKFGSQFSLVEKLKVPYVMIMGKKESIDNTVMVRDNSTRSQQTVLIENLSDYIKELPLE
jgi:histidyl-tRNA synthetase